MSEELKGTNWPNPERLGVPPNPDMSGWYWIQIGSLERPLYWDSGKTPWFTANQAGSPRWICSQNWKFLGAVLTPTQISEMLAGERERCADVCRAMSFDNVYGKPARVALEVADMTIRNLGAAS